MKYLESISNDILTKISVWQKAKDDVSRLGKELYDQSKKNIKLIVNLLDIIDQKRIKIPVETEDKIFSIMEINLSPKRNSMPAIHIGGGDVIIHWMYKKTKLKNFDSLWNFTATSDTDSHEYESVAVILDYLIKKYPKAVEELKRREDSAKFGI